VTAAAIAGGFGCGASAGPGVSATGAPTAVARSDRSTITNEELQATRETSLYNAIQRLRPEWLRSRGATSIASGMAGNQGADAINVYQDLQKLGSLDVLRSMPLTQAGSLKFYSAGEAQQRFGTGNPSGAIQIITAP
jgi:hypothetical protein